MGAGHVRIEHDLPFETLVFRAEKIDAPGVWIRLAYNGAGKTTLSRAVYPLFDRDSGHLIWVYGDFDKTTEFKASVEIAGKKYSARVKVVVWGDRLKVDVAPENPENGYLYPDAIGKHLIFTNDSFLYREFFKAIHQIHVRALRMAVDEILANERAAVSQCRDEDTKRAAEFARLAAETERELRELEEKEEKLRKEVDKLEREIAAELSKSARVAREDIEAVLSKRRTAEAIREIEGKIREKVEELNSLPRPSAGPYSEIDREKQRLLADKAAWEKEKGDVSSLIAVLHRLKSDILALQPLAQVAVDHLVDQSILINWNSISGSFDQAIQRWSLEVGRAISSLTHELSELDKKIQEIDSKIRELERVEQEKKDYESRVARLTQEIDQLRRSKEAKERELAMLERHVGEILTKYGVGSEDELLSMASRESEAVSRLRSKKAEIEAELAGVSEKIKELRKNKEHYEKLSKSAATVDLQRCKEAERRIETFKREYQEAVRHAYQLYDQVTRELSPGTRSAIVLREGLELDHRNYSESERHLIIGAHMYGIARALNAVGIGVPFILFDITLADVTYSTVAKLARLFHDLFERAGTTTLIFAAADHYKLIPYPEGEKELVLMLSFRFGLR